VSAEALQRKNPPRIAADGFWAKQFTLNKTPWLTGPVKRISNFLSTGCVKTIVHQRAKRASRLARAEHRAARADPSGCQSRHRSEVVELAFGLHAVYRAIDHRWRR
jgi:hypothetical protein